MTAADLATEQPATTSTKAHSGPRTDIQGLRAIAVAAVVLYHFWPKRLTGGYVGVDVFLVISGFLITSHLLRQRLDSGRELLGFWARRIRRLLPSACLVLAVTLLASVLWAPDTMLPRIGHEVLSSALYVENWYLAHEATDYLAAAQADTPVMHYWSLSLEEQFYLLWPLLFAVLAFVSRRTSRRAGRWLPFAATLVVALASLAYSIHLTAHDPAAAYFVSTTRFWELAIGGVLAASLLLELRWSPPAALRSATAWVGLAMIVWTTVTFTGSTAFPGSAALLPVLGAALVIAADADGTRWGPGRLLALRPVQWLGDVSYLVYLWHWPLYVITPFILGHVLAWPEKILLGLLTLLLAEGTKRLLEDPIRFHRALKRRLRPNYVVLVVSVGVVVAMSCASLLWTSNDLAHAEAQDIKAKKELGVCYGAGAVRHPGKCASDDHSVVTNPMVATEDLPFVYKKNCRNVPPYHSRITCRFGAKKNPTTRIALVGNSHASHWIPALQRILRKNPHAQVTTYLASYCYTVDMKVVRSKGNCKKLEHWSINAISKGDYDLVVMSNRMEGHIEGVGDSDDAQADAAEKGYRTTLRKFRRSGAGVMVVRDTPFMVNPVPDCIAEHNMNWKPCRIPRKTAVERDPAAEVGTKMKGITVLNLTHYFCDARFCKPVIGRAIAYSDHGHLTASFARSLAPDVCDAMDEATTEKTFYCRGLGK